MSCWWVTKAFVNEKTSGSALYRLPGRKGIFRVCASRRPERFARCSGSVSRDSCRLMQNTCRQWLQNKIPVVNGCRKRTSLSFRCYWPCHCPGIRSGQTEQNGLIRQSFSGSPARGLPDQGNQTVDRQWRALIACLARASRRAKQLARLIISAAPWVPAPPDQAAQPTTQWCGHVCCWTNRRRPDKAWFRWYSRDGNRPAALCMAL